MKRIWLTTLLVASVAVWTVGCGGGDKGKQAESGGDKPEGGQTAQDGQGGDGTVKPAETAETAEEAAKQWYGYLAEGQYADMWRMYPESNRKQVNEIVHAAAGKVDAELWSSAFATVKKGASVLESKREYVLAGGNFEPPFVPQNLVPTVYDAAVGLLTEIANSDFADHGKATTEDAGEMAAQLLTSVQTRLESVAADSNNEMLQSLLADAKASVKEYSIEPVTSEGDTATLKVTTKQPKAGSDDEGNTKVTWAETTEEVQFVRVDGVWLPKDASESMNAQLPVALEQVQAFEITDDQKGFAKMAIAEINKSLDALAATDSQESFDKTLHEEMTRLGEIIPLGGGGDNGPGPESEEVDPGGVTSESTSGDEKVDE